MKEKHLDEAIVGYYGKNEAMNPNSETDSINDYTQWGIFLGGKYKPVTKTISTIPAGFYEINNEVDLGVHLQRKTVNSDELFELPSLELLDIIKDIESFWQRKDMFKKCGFIYKRGILLYGSPGMGKSGIIQLCTKYLIEKLNGIVINISTSDHIFNYSTAITNLRQVEPERPIIVILEDIDSIMVEGGRVSSLVLNILDGVKQINNVVYIATTNYPEQLEERITNRPSRFDRRYEIKPPTRDVRQKYFEYKLSNCDIENIDLEKWLKETEGMSLAHLKELIISVVAMGNDFQETIDRLNGLKIKPKIESHQLKKIGFEGENECCNDNN